MLTRIISGGQSGVDVAALRAAKAALIPTGGWMPKAFVAEDGFHPEYAELYGLKEMAIAGYQGRTLANVRDSDGTLILSGARPLAGGTLLTLNTCKRLNKTWRVVVLESEEWGLYDLGQIDGWVCACAVRVLNVAGTRESKCPGIGARAERFLAELLRLLKEGSSP